SITADGAEAELAIAPVALAPGADDRAAAAAWRGRRALVRALPDGFRLEGYSTHLSVSVAAGTEERVARRFADTFGPALLLLMDGPASPGLLVRPRPGRLELGGEFVDGDRLRAAIVFAAGATLAVERAVRSSPWQRPLPRRAVIDVEPARDRFGWLVQGVVGADLHAAGRSARIRLRDRRGRTADRTITGQELLEGCWAVARAALQRRVEAAALALVDRYVMGDAALGVELPQAEAIAPAREIAARARDVEATAASAEAVGGPFGAAVAVRHRPGLTIEPAMLGWDFAVLRITEDLGTVRGRTAFACLPRSVLGPGLDAIDRGHLDAILRAYLNLNADPRVLAGAPQTRRPGLFGAVATGSRLLAHELGPDLPDGDRPGKRGRRPRDSQSQASQPPPPTPSALPAGAAPAAAAAAAAAGFTLFGVPAAAAAAVAGVATVAVIGGAILLGGGPSPSANPGGTSTAGASGVLPTDPDGVPVVGPVVFQSGEATVTVFTDAGAGSITQPLTAGEIGEDGLLIASWSDGVFIPGSGTTGISQWLDVEGLITADGRFEPFEGLETDFGVWLDNGEQVNATAALDFGCEVDLRRTVTDGIDGTVRCAGVDQELGGFTAEGTFWAEPDPGQGPGPTEAPGIAYVVGGATIRATGDADGSAVLTFTSDDAAGPSGYPHQLLWGDSTGSGPFLGIATTSSHPYGIQTTSDGNVRVAWGLDATTSTSGGPFFLNGFVGGAGSPGGPVCTVAMFPTATGGVEGDFSCSNVADGDVGVEGEFWADYVQGGPTVQYSVGEASMFLTGDGEGSATMVFAGESESGPAGGPLYPVLTWADDSALNVLGIYTLEPHGVGELSTADGTLGVGFAFGDVIIAGFPETFWSNGLGLGHDGPIQEGLGCTASIRATPTGGIEGTVSCPNFNDPSLPIGLEGTFWAEPGGAVGTG
ncbi:MAG TPA: hypothetical protein VFX65_01670, partial [Candidatus Limnocylindrales bacterium]|nr:hypothetical protein [Candidatus Limnocylindrales bacterium]